MAKKGKKLTEEHKKKIGLANAKSNKGKICSAKGLKKIIEMHKMKSLPL